MYFGNIECIYFVIKDEIFFDKNKKIWEKVSNMINEKLIVNLYMTKDI